MRARLVLAAAVVALGGAVTSAQAAPPPLPVSVTVGPAGVCVTISLQVPQCVPVSFG